MKHSEPQTTLPRMDPTPYPASAQQHHQMPVTATFSDVTVPNVSCSVFAHPSPSAPLQKDLHGLTCCQTQGMVSLVPCCGMILKHSAQSE